MDYSESFKGERALLYENEDSNSYLLLARNPREAIAHFALQSEQNPGMGINVHIDGLQQRTAQSFGAPFSSLSCAQYLLLIGFALLSKQVKRQQRSIHWAINHRRRQT